MPKLIALTPIQHDGVQYAVGETLDVKDKAQAAALVEAGAASDPKSAPAEQPAE